MNFHYYLYCKAIEIPLVPKSPLLITYMKGDKFLQVRQTIYKVSQTNGQPSPLMMNTRAQYPAKENKNKKDHLKGNIYLNNDEALLQLAKITNAFIKFNQLVEGR